MEVLQGPVEIRVDRQILSLDRPFTYELPADLGAGVGSLVEVTFHGKRARGWVVGPSEEIPARMLPVRKLVSPVRFFDADSLRLLRWVSQRYVAPLATVIERSHPPRVASEEGEAGKQGGRASRDEPGPAGRAPVSLRPTPLLDRYRNGETLVEALDGGSGAFVVRPGPLDEQALAVEAVSRCLAGGRRAVVLIPEADPLPATARALVDALGDRAALFVGGSKRSRYRMWLDLKDGAYDCVIGTRPAVFAPMPTLGLIWISRESHGLHREERSPYYHVRDVALARAGLEGAVVSMAAFCPSVEAAGTEAMEVSPRSRTWPPVEVVPPGPEGRAPRLVNELKKASSAFLLQSLRGYGIARVCRSCGEPASCPDCGGVIRQEEGRFTCGVCGVEGRCPVCGGRVFGVQRGGAEHVAEWASRIGGLEAQDPPPGPGRLLVGGSEVVKEVPPPHLDLVGILDADLAERRPGLSAAEHALAVWMEAASWAAGGGRVVVATRSSNAPVIQSLVQGDPARFHRAERVRREQAGFPVGFPVFRVIGGAELRESLRSIDPVTSLVTSRGDETICLVTVRPDRLPATGRALRDLAVRGVVTRVEAEPHL